MRVLGVDPGLTRCGIGVVDGDNYQNLQMVGVGVIRTDVTAPLEARLLQLEVELITWIKKYKPDVIAVERVFSQLNVKTAMATGQAAGVALLIAARSGIPVAMHTPSEVKAAVSGSGRADKKQVAEMVKKLLKLKTGINKKCRIVFLRGMTVSSFFSLFWQSPHFLYGHSMLHLYF